MSTLDPVSQMPAVSHLHQVSSNVIHIISFCSRNKAILQSMILNPASHYQCNEGRVTVVGELWGRRRVIPGL